jgi:hypothetical protein
LRAGEWNASRELESTLKWMKVWFLGYRIGKNNANFLVGINGAYKNDTRRGLLLRMWKCVWVMKVGNMGMGGNCKTPTSSLSTLNPSFIEDVARGEFKLWL